MTAYSAPSPDFSAFDIKARGGEKLTVAFFGGSLTWGARSSDPQKTSYRAIIGRKLQETYPEARFNFIESICVAGPEPVTVTCEENQDLFINR